MFKFGKKKESIDISAIANAYGNCVNLIKGGHSVSERLYAEARVIFNQAVIEACLGAVIDGDKMKFNKKLPDADERTQIIGYVSHLSETEKILYATNNSGNDDDISVLPMRTGYSVELKKINTKAVKEYILGGMINSGLDVANTMQLFEIGKKLRKKQHRNMMLLVGGIAILITGAAVATVLIVHHNKKSVDEIDTPDASIDDADIADIGDIDDDIGADVPQCDADI